MLLRTLILSAAVVMAFGPASAELDAGDLSGPPEKVTSDNSLIPPSPETKDDYRPPEPAPKEELPTCATPRDGQESKDEGERVMCDTTTPRPS